MEATYRHISIRFDGSIKKYAERFNGEEEAVLSHFFTNMDKPVYGLVNMPNDVCVGSN
ncbi:MAG: hypothetical protein QXN59_02190 [Candidatus Micrarchaeaceae archaeon]